MKYKLVCMSSNSRHTRFALFDRGSGAPHSPSETRTRADCGTITLDTDDLVHFLQHDWQGDVEWRGHCPAGAMELYNRGVDDESA